ncbi:MAG: hypothetical protein R3F07_13795 [Opitutaceae bacterium]
MVARLRPIDDPARHPMKTWSLRLALAVLLPLAFFLLLEAGLRIGGFDRDTRFFIPDEQPGFLRTNPRYTELFFPASFGLKPLNFRVKKEKPAGSIRILVIGESAAMGVPEPGFSLSPQMKAYLESVLPDRQIEVLNLGVTAVNSHVIRHLARQAVELHPDLLVIYMGNNEVVGPFGPSSATTLGMPPLPLIRASIALRSTRSGQLLERLIGRAGAVGGKFREWRGMEMFAGHTVGAEDPRMEAVYGNFRSNLESILSVARSHGIRTVLSTVAVNVRDSSPFASLHHPSILAGDVEAWSGYFGKARLAEGREAQDEARDLLRKALEHSPQHADTHFLLARILEREGDANGARLHYLEALQWDALRFRADAEINSIIREVAAEYPEWCRLVDAANLLGADSGSSTNLPGRESFFEHVHLNWMGNYRLAALLASASVDLLGFGEPGGDDRLAWDYCANRIGLTDSGRAMMLMGMDGLASRPPFTGQMNHALDRKRLLSEIAAVNGLLAEPGRLQEDVERVEGALRAQPDDPFLHFHAATLNARIGKTRRALELSKELEQLEPPSPEQAVQRAYLLAELGRKREAEVLLLETAEESPYYFQTYSLLGALWADRSTIDRALSYFSDLVVRMPTSLGARHTYARLLDLSGNSPGAENQWLEILALVPDDEGALAPLVERRMRGGERSQAIRLMQRAFDYNPRSQANNARLVEVFDPVTSPEQSVVYLTALTESGPVGPAVFLQLADVLNRLGRSEESLVALYRARATAGESGQEELSRMIGEAIRAGRNPAPAIPGI